MARAAKRTTTPKAAEPKPKHTARRGNSPRRKPDVHARKLDTLRFSERLDEIAGRLAVVAIAIFGIEEVSNGDPALSPLMWMVQEISGQVSAIANEMVK